MTTPMTGLCPMAMQKKGVDDLSSRLDGREIQQVTLALSPSFAKMHSYGEMGRLDMLQKNSR